MCGECQGNPLPWVNKMLGLSNIFINRPELITTHDDFDSADPSRMKDARHI